MENNVIRNLKALAMLTWISTFVLLMMALTILNVSGRLAGEQVEPNARLAAWIFIIFALLTFAIGIGLWRKRKWAYKISVVVYGVGVISILYSLLKGVSSIKILGLIEQGYIFWYLLTPPVKDFFKAQG